jgi:hypothetical protein
LFGRVSLRECGSALLRSKKRPGRAGCMLAGGGHEHPHLVGGWAHS